MNDLVAMNKTMVTVEQSNSQLLSKTLRKLDELSTRLSRPSDFAGMKKNLSEERLKELGGRMKSRFTDKDISLMETALEKSRTPATSDEIVKIWFAEKM